MGSVTSRTWCVGVGIFSCNGCLVRSLRMSTRCTRRRIPERLWGSDGRRGTEDRVNRELKSRGTKSNAPVSMDAGAFLFSKETGMRSVLLLAVLLITGVAAAQVKPEQIDAIFRPLTNDQSPGLSVGVIHDGKLVFARGYGL